MTFLEIFERIILPAGGMLSLFTALLIFLFGKPDRKADRKKIEAEVEKILAERDTEMQDYWHKEFERLNSRVDELETEKKGQDLTIKELTAENAKLKEAQRAQEIDLEKKDKVIKSLEKRIEGLEELLRFHGIDPEGRLNSDE